MIKARTNSRPKMGHLRPELALSIKKKHLQVTAFKSVIMIKKMIQNRSFKIKENLIQHPKRNQGTEIGSQAVAPKVVLSAKSLSSALYASPV